jgi:hypothetical protein
MTAFRFVHHVLGVTVAVAILAGCSGWQQQIPATGASAETGSGLRRNAMASHAGEPLLYVARAHDAISILSLRDDKAVALIRGYGYAAGVCSDPLGNVWVTNYRHGRFYVDEFAHGGTKAIAHLRAPNGSNLAGCAVDPISGDLAVVGYNTILVWSGARDGKPTRYSVYFAPLFAAYDNAGNLFVTGWEGGSDWFFVMAELAKGSQKVTNIRLDRHAYEPGEVQWDGKYVVVATTVNRRTRNPFSNKSVFRLYRLQVSGKSGHVVQVVQPQRLRNGDSETGVLFVLHDRTIIGVAGKKRESLLAWSYPLGGKAMGTIAHYRDIHALAISE